MSLLEPSSPAHAPGLRRFAARLRAGDEHDRALLLNLQEEDRIPESRRHDFHAALVNSRRRGWKQRFCEAARAAERALPVPTPRPAEISGPWWTYLPFSKLTEYKYVSPALHRISRPPSRVALRRLIGRPVDGADRVFWITTATSMSADDIRNRLGLCQVTHRERLYRVVIAIDAAPNRPLYVPTALDAGFYPAWRHPGAGHTGACGLTRHLETDAPSERELLALPDAADAMEAHHVGVVKTAAPCAYLRLRGIL